MMTRAAYEKLIAEMDATPAAKLFLKLANTPVEQDPETDPKVQAMFRCMVNLRHEIEREFAPLVKP